MGLFNKNKINTNEINEAILDNDFKKLKKKLDYAKKNKIILNLNEKDKHGDYPLLLATRENNIEMVQLLIDYANKNKIILNLNEKVNIFRWYPLFLATNNNNIEMVQLLIDYANKNKIILEMNKKDNDGNYPLLLATDRNNNEMVQLLKNYEEETKKKLISNEISRENERLEKEKIEREITLLKLEKERMERERMEKERIEKEKMEREKIEKENEILKLKLKEMKIDNYKKELKKLIEHSNYNIIQEDFYEWEVNNWNKLSNEIFSPIFDAVNHKWKISLNPKIVDEEDHKEYIAIGLDILDINEENENKNIHIATNFIFAIRNFEDNSCFFAEIYEDQPVYYSMNKLSRGIKEFILNNELFNKNDQTKKAIIENNKAIIDTYIFSYKYDKEQYMEELNNLIENNDEEEEEEEERKEIINYSEWEINVSSVTKKKFKLNKYEWRVSFYPNKMNEKYLSLKIENLNIITEDEDEDSSIQIFAKCVASVRNINDYSRFWAKGTSLINFNNDNERYIIEEFIEKEILLNENNEINKIADNGKIKLGILLKIKQNE